MNRAALMCVMLSFVTAGCMMQNLKPEERLRDAVFEYNDHVRWHRIDTAAQMVSGEFQEEFKSLHRLWGKNILIADTEVKQVVIDRSKDVARSVVTFNWYAQGNMEIVQTEVEQNWKKSGQSFVLISERVIAGAANLLSSPEEPVSEVEDWNYPDSQRPETAP